MTQDEDRKNDMISLSLVWVCSVVTFEKGQHIWDDVREDLSHLHVESLGWFFKITSNTDKTYSHRPRRPVPISVSQVAKP